MSNSCPSVLTVARIGVCPLPKESASTVILDVLLVGGSCSDGDFHRNYVRQHQGYVAVYPILMRPSHVLLDSTAGHLDQHRMLLQRHIFDFRTFLATCVGIRTCVVSHGPMESARGILVGTFLAARYDCPRQGFHFEQAGQGVRARQVRLSCHARSWTLLTVFS